MSERLQHRAWSSIPPEQLNPLLSRQFVHGEQAMLSRIQLQKGCIVPWHSHPNEQIVFILSGILRFTVGEEGSEKHVYDVHGGETLVIPGNIPHMAEALEDTDNLDIFAPPRHDWITGNDAYLRRK